jgi:hypothetical protein
VTSLYTSYETSLALKEAGAPQDGAERHWYISIVARGPKLINPADDLPAGACRAWRLDEILAALHGHLWQIGEADNLDYVCGAYTQAGAGGEWTAASSPPALPWSPVEAAAACWLSVLKGGGK